MKPRRKPLGEENTIGQQLTYIRKKKKLTIRELCVYMQLEGIPIAESALAKIERQTRKVYDKELFALMKILDTDFAQQKKSRC